MFSIKQQRALQKKSGPSFIRFLIGIQILHKCMVSIACNPYSITWYVRTGLVDYNASIHPLNSCCLLESSYGQVVEQVQRYHFSFGWSPVFLTEIFLSIDHWPCSLCNASKGLTKGQIICSEILYHGYYRYCWRFYTLAFDFGLGYCLVLLRWWMPWCKCLVILGQSSMRLQSLESKYSIQELRVTLRAMFEQSLYILRYNHLSNGQNIPDDNWSWAISS